MIYIEHNADSCSDYKLVCDQQVDAKPIYIAKTYPQDKDPLVEEIRVLRIKLEDTVMEIRSMTSPIVIEVSRLLDDKINEYMKLWKTRS